MAGKSLVSYSSSDYSSDEEEKVDNGAKTLERYNINTGNLFVNRVSRVSRFKWELGKKCKYFGCIIFRILP